MASRNSKRTYTISSETVQEFERLVPPGARSRTVERLLRDANASLVRERRRISIAEGLAYMADESDETTVEWQGVDTEGWPKP